LGKGLIDSTGVLELVDFLQEHFAIKVEDEEVIPDNLDSVRNIATYVARKISCVV
jgi:acyl carrier protein